MPLVKSSTGNSRTINFDLSFRLFENIPLREYNN